MNAFLIAAAVYGLPRCDGCGMFFDPASVGYKRRPRANVSAWCSAACRVKGKLASNRASWHRNKERWRPAGSRAK